VAEDEQLAKAASAEISTMRPPPMGFDGFTEDDLIIPRYSIVQKSSEAVDKGAQVGMLVSNISDKEMETVRCTPLLYRKGMVKFVKPYKKGEQPECKSNDAMVPSPAVDKPFNDVCHIIKKRRLVAVCPKAKWTENDKGKPMPPECNLCFNVIFKEDESQMSFFMSFRSSALKAWKKFLTQMWALQRNLFSVSILLSTEDDENEYGKFKIPMIGELVDHEPDAEAELVDLYKSMQMMDLDASFDDERNQGDDGAHMDEGDSSFDTGELDQEAF